MSFIEPEMLTKIPSMTRAQLDDLPFGAIKVDDEGVVEIYNKTESELAGFPIDEAEGRNFFREIAPCCNNRLLFGRFKTGVKSGSLDFTIPYTFTYKMRPTNVFLTLHRDERDSNWIFIRRR